MVKLLSYYRKLSNYFIELFAHVSLVELYVVNL